MGEWYLENKVYIQGMLAAAVASRVVGPFGRLCQEMFVW